MCSDIKKSSLWFSLQLCEMASLIPNVLEGCDGFLCLFFLIPPCWNQPCAVSNWWFIKRCAGVARSHDNKSEVFTFVFPRDVWARPRSAIESSHKTHCACRSHSTSAIRGDDLQNEHICLREINIIAASCAGRPHVRLVLLYIISGLVAIKRRGRIQKIDEPAACLSQMWSQSQSTVMKTILIITLAAEVLKSFFRVQVANLRNRFVKVKEKKKKNRTPWQIEALQLTCFPRYSKLTHISRQTHTDIQLSPAKSVSSTSGVHSALALSFSRPS